MKLFMGIAFICAGLFGAEPESCALRLRYTRFEASSIVTGHGTAFGIDLAKYNLPGKTFLLTAAHNVLDDTGKPYTTLQVEIRGAWVACSVLRINKDLDIALLESSEMLSIVAKLAKTDAAQNAPVSMHASAKDAPVQVFSGVLTHLYYAGGLKWLAQIPFDHGCSGAPVFSGHKVIGMAVSGIPKDGDLDKTKGLFLPASVITYFLAGTKE